MDREDTNSYNHILKYTGVFGGVQGLNIILGLVRTKLVAILLGPSGVGLVSLFNSAVTFISQSTNFGLSLSAVKHISEIFDSEDKERVRHFVIVVRCWSMASALLGMAVCIALGPLLSDLTFAWGNHTLHFILLSPAVGLIAITSGETAILKGARRLKSLAKISIYTVCASLVISVPVYFFFGESGIVPVIVLMALATMLFTIHYSLSLFPLPSLRHFHTIDHLREGSAMIRLGMAFLFAGVLGSGAEMLVRSYLNKVGDLDTVGFFSAGYMLIITYAGMVFTAMETDFFPRLSAVNRDTIAANNVVNRQIEVSLLIIAPMLAALLIALPILIPLLFSGKFLPVVAMAQAGLFSMYMKAVALPIEYITLARGDSFAYMFLEGVCDVVMVALIIAGWHHSGLLGIGFALTLWYLADLIIVAVYARMRYHYKVSLYVIRFFLVQMSFGIAAYMVTRLLSGLSYWVAGVGIVVFSLLFSIYMLRRKTGILSLHKKKTDG